MSKKKNQPSAGVSTAKEKVPPLAPLSATPPPLLTTIVAPPPAGPHSEAKPVPEAVRIRKIGTGTACPECGGDAFVTSTRTHPTFIERRMRHYRCGKCHHRFKVS